MKKVFWLALFIGLTSGVFAQTDSAAYFFKYDRWIQTLDSIKPSSLIDSTNQQTLALYKLGEFQNAIESGLRQTEKDSITFSIIRNSYIALDDHQRAMYFHRKLSKSFRKKYNFKRYFFSGYNLNPVIIGIDNEKYGRPAFGFNFGFNTDILPQWKVAHQFTNLVQDVTNYSYSQSQYNLKTSFQFDPKWSTNFNYHSSKVLGEIFYGEGEYLVDTISASEPIVDHTHRNTFQEGTKNKTMKIVNLGFQHHTPGLDLGINFGRLKTTFKDSLFGTTTDSTIRRTTVQNGNFIESPPVVTETDSTSFNSNSSRTFQISLNATYTLPGFNNGLKVTSWVDIPFSNNDIGLSPYVKTQLRLTPNTWVGGWYRYYHKQTPMELGGTVINFGLDDVSMKYGGEIQYQKSKRWWIVFNLELQKRKEYLTQKKYSTLKLDFNFVYKLYR